MVRPASAPPHPRMTRLSHLALVLLVLLVFGQTLTFSFIKLDDNQYVTENPHVLDGLSVTSLRWAFIPSGYAANWHPLVWLSLMLDVELYGAWAGGFHLTNVLLHALNCLLIFGLLNRWTGETARSFFVAALFAVHPLHVESVAWVSERKDVLSTFFGLLSLGAYARYSERLRIGWILAAWLCLLLSLMSKQMLVTLPCLLFLLDFWPLRRTTLTGAVALSASHQDKARTPDDQNVQSRRRLIFEKIPFAALSVVFCAVAVWAQQAGGAMHTFDRIPLGARLSNAAVSYGIYLRQTFWPTDLAVFYPLPPAGRGWPEVSVSVLVLFGVTVWALRAWRRRPWFLTGWLWFLVTLLPVIGIIQVGDQAHADRYMYFPQIGLLIACTWLIDDALQRNLRGLLARSGVAAILLLASTLLTWNQVGYWKNSLSLFSHALDVTTDNWLAHATLGSALMDTPDRINEADDHLRESLQIRPNNPPAHYNLALRLSDRGDLSQANLHFHEALRLKPDYVKARILLCVNLKRLGQSEELAREFAGFDTQQQSWPQEMQPAIDYLRSP
jgi:protein O-mannosyl-transferase